MRFVCIVIKDNKQVMLCCNVWIAWSMKIQMGYFFSFLWWLHEIVKENAAWKWEQTALEGLGSQGWQGNRPRHKLYPMGHIPQPMEKVSWWWWPVWDPSLWLPGWAVVLRQLWGRAGCQGLAKHLGRWDRAALQLWHRDQGWALELKWSSSQ